MKKKIPNKKTVTNDEIAYPTRRTVLPFRSGESTSEAHRTRSRSRRPRGGGRRRRVEEEEEVPPGVLLLLLLRRVVVVAVSSRIVRFLFIESVSGVLFYFYFFSPKP